MEIGVVGEGRVRGRRGGREPVCLDRETKREIAWSSTMNSPLRACLRSKDIDEEVTATEVSARCAPSGTVKQARLRVGKFVLMMERRKPRFLKVDESEFGFPVGALLAAPGASGRYLVPGEPL